MTAVTLDRAIDTAGRDAVKALAAYYVYDMSAFLEGEEGWRMPDDGRFPLPAFFDDYWEADGTPVAGYAAYLIWADGELCGFVLLRTVGLEAGLDVHLSEFFVTSKKRRTGVGRAAVHMLMDRYPGRWELMQLPRNLPAIQFWEKVIRERPVTRFKVEQKLMDLPSPHFKMVMTFDNPGVGDG